MGLSAPQCYLDFHISIVRMYSYIFSETRRQQRSQTEHLSAEEIATIRRNNRAAKTLGIVLGTLLATYLPTIIFIIMYYSVNLERRVLNCIASWVATLVMLGSLCNPLVYCWRKDRGIAPGLFGDSSFKKSRKQPVTRSDRGASHSTSSLA